MTGKHIQISLPTVDVKSMHLLLFDVVAVLKFTLTIRDSTPQSDSLSSRKASRVSLLQQHRKAFFFFFFIKDMEFMTHWAVMDEVIKLQSSYNLGSLIRCWIKRLVSSFEAIFTTLSLCHSFCCQKMIDLSFSQISLSGFFFLCWSGLCHCCLHTYCAPSNHQMCKCLMFKHWVFFFMQEFQKKVMEEESGEEGAPSSQAVNQLLTRM